MSKWKRRYFYIPIEGKAPVLASGPAHRGLAMVNLRAGLWSLTHINSGHRIFQIQGSKAECYKLAEGIANLIDWDAYQRAEEVTQIPGLVLRISALIELHAGSSDLVAGHA